MHCAADLLKLLVGNPIAVVKEMLIIWKYCVLYY